MTAIITGNAKTEVVPEARDAAAWLAGYSGAPKKGWMDADAYERGNKTYHADRERIAANREKARHDAAA